MVHWIFIFVALAFGLFFGYCLAKLEFKRQLKEKGNMAQTDVEAIKGEAYQQGRLIGQRQLMVRLQVENKATTGLLIYDAEWVALQNEIKDRGINLVPPDFWSRET